LLGEAKLRDIFATGFDDFLVGVNTYDVRARYRFAVTMLDDFPPVLFQASAAAGYAASTPDLFARNFAELELEALQRMGETFSLTLAPKLELSDYLQFPGGDERRDAAFSLRVIPAWNLGNGFSVSTEGQVTVTLSTREAKTGETWSITPILRLQKAL
jgi:hypothetical protein